MYSFTCSYADMLFNVELYTKVSYVIGNGGTGKSKLCQAIEGIDGEVISEQGVKVITIGRYLELKQLDALTSSVPYLVVVDEFEFDRTSRSYNAKYGDIKLHTLIQESCAMWLIVTRKFYFGINTALTSIYKVESQPYPDKDKTYRFLCHLVPLYPRQIYDATQKYDCAILEDRAFGWRLFNKYVCAGSLSGIRYLRSITPRKAFLALDTSALSSCHMTVQDFIELGSFLWPESSFEAVICKALHISRPSDPYWAIQLDMTKQTLEREITSILQQWSKDHYMSYSKDGFSCDSLKLSKIEDAVVAYLRSNYPNLQVNMKCKKLCQDCPTCKVSQEYKTLRTNQRQAVAEELSHLFNY